MKIIEWTTDNTIAVEGDWMITATLKDETTVWSSFLTDVPIISDDDERVALEAMCLQHGVSLSNVVEVVLDQYLWDEWETRSTWKM